jgi:hypothetical protein
VEKDAPLFRNWAIHTGIKLCILSWGKWSSVTHTKYPGLWPHEDSSENPLTCPQTRLEYMSTHFITQWWCATHPIGSLFLNFP